MDDEDDDFEEEFEEGEEEEEEDLDPDNPDHAFAILEKEFTKTVAEIEQDPNVAQYADGFNKLFETLYETHEHERELSEKCDDLQEQLEEKTDKLNVALKVVEVDATTIADLKGQIEHAWRMADAAHAREQLAQEIIDNMRKQVDTLTAEIDLKNKMGQDDSEELGQLSKTQDGLQREKEKLQGELVQITTKLTNALGYQEELERRNSAADLKINELASQIEENATEFERQQRMKAKQDADFKELNEALEKKDRETDDLQCTMHAIQRQNNRLENTLQAQKQLHEKLTKDFEGLSSKYEKTQDNLSNLTFLHDDLKKEYTSRCHELKLRDDEAIKLRSDVNKFEKVLETYDKKMKKLQLEREEVISDRDKLRQLLSNIERDLDGCRKQGEVDKRSIDNVNREKDILNKSILRYQAVTKDNIKLVKIQEQTRKKLEAEIDEYLNEGAKHKKHISYLEKERDRLVEEGLDLTKKIEDQMDEIKLKKKAVYDLKKTVAENENKLRMQQNLFEAVRADRNSLQKALQESASECGELKMKLKVSNHQTEQLKEDIAMKEQLLVKEETILRKMTKERENLRIELNGAVETIKTLKSDLAELTAEEKRLHKVILEADRLTRQQAKDLEQLMNERDILGSQLVRRNDELALLYEKIKILQSTLHRGEAQYEQRLDDIKLLKIEIRRLRQEKTLLSKSVSNMTDLRQEVFLLERDLVRERLRCRALEEELQNPLNIHRWRKLEGSDPEVLELLRKMQLLQKRLLQQTSEAIERERQLKEAEKLYINLRQVLSRQPGPEIQAELNKTQRALTLRGKKMKCLVSELNMAEQQALEYKHDLVKVQVELKELKKKHMREKKAQEKRLNILRETNSKDMNQSGSAEQIKFTGGGFRMSITGSVNN